jgi:hypothetical protein
MTSQAPVPPMVPMPSSADAQPAQTWRRRL